MRAGTMLLLVFGVLVFTVILIFAALRSTDPNRMSMKEKRELNRLRDLVDSLDTLAYSHRELDSALAVQIIDEISQSKRKARGELR